MARFRRSAVAAFACCALAAASARAQVAETAPDREPAAPEAAAVKAPPERVFGWELMTDEEFAAQRARMRAATTREERDRIRSEHHAQMQARAQERGVELIGPVGRPGRMGPRGGAGPGRGAGPGAGAGPGGGTGPRPPGPGPGGPPPAGP